MDEGLIRHIILTSILSYKKKYSEYGEVVICCDGPHSWRKGVYPYYKASRKKGREDSTIDWTELYRILDLVRTELNSRMPYKVLKLEGAEADDCIATLAKSYPSPHVVISNDKDFGQLLRHKGVKQYSPLKGTEVKIANPEQYLKEHIINGDRGDDVPNILSDDDVFVTPGKRQKSIFKKKLVDWLKQDFSQFAEADKIKRNITMIDLDHIPNDIHNKIVDEFNGQEVVSRREIYPYFVEKKLSRLLEDIQYF